MPLPANPTTVVTGAASGLGRAIAVEVGRRRGRVVVADVHETRMAEAVEAITAAGGEATAVHCDVSVAAQVEELARVCLERWGTPDLVVNNAGVAVAGRTGETPMADWEFVVGVNLWGVIHGCHAFVPHLRRAGKGHVLNVASAAGFAAVPEMAPYNVTKAGVIGLSETLYAELRPDGVGVSVLCPTFFPTNLMESFRSPEDRQRKLAEALFARSKLSAEAVAAAGLAAVESDRLYAIPQADGRWVWRLKRWLPRTYHRLLARRQRQVAERLVADAGVETREE